MGEGDSGLLHLTEEEIATGDVKASAREGGSDNELDELQELTIKKKLLSCIRDGIGAIINYVGSSRNGELHAYYENLQSVGKIVIKNWSRGLFRQNLTVSSSMHYYIKKQIQLQFISFFCLLWSFLLN